MRQLLVLLWGLAFILSMVLLALRYIATHV